MTAGQVTIHGHSGRSLRGIKIITGTVVLDGDNPTPIDLSAYGAQCLGGIVSIRSVDALGDGTTAVTCSASGATLNVYGWTTADGADPTMVASAIDTTVVDFVATVRA